MKTFIVDIFPKLKNFSKKLDNLTLLMNQPWVAIDDINKNKNVYIFRDNKELLISNRGLVEKAKWEYLGYNSLLIEKEDHTYLFKQSFFDEYVLALKVDGNDEYAVFVNENKFDGELNSIEDVVDFLEIKYLDQNQIESITGGYYKNKELEQEYDYITENEKKERQIKSALADKNFDANFNTFFYVIVFLIIVIMYFRFTTYFS